MTYIVGYVDDLIVADRSDQNHVSKQIMECIQKYWKVSDEGTLTRFIGVHFTRDANGGPHIHPSHTHYNLTHTLQHM